MPYFIRQVVHLAHYLESNSSRSRCFRAVVFKPPEVTLTFHITSSAIDPLLWDCGLCELMWSQATWPSNSDALPSSLFCHYPESLSGTSMTYRGTPGFHGTV